MCVALLPCRWLFSLTWRAHSDTHEHAYTHGHTLNHAHPDTCSLSFIEGQFYGRMWSPLWHCLWKRLSNYITQYKHLTQTNQHQHRHPYPSHILSKKVHLCIKYIHKNTLQTPSNHLQTNAHVSISYLWKNNNCWVVSSLFPSWVWTTVFHLRVFDLLFCTSHTLQYALSFLPTFLSHTNVFCIPCRLLQQFI